jgi:hypothetical protein
MLPGPGATFALYLSLVAVVLRSICVFRKKEKKPDKWGRREHKSTTGQSECLRPTANYSFEWIGKIEVNNLVAWRRGVES